jgi:hypothetical protein
MAETGKVGDSMLEYSNPADTEELLKILAGVYKEN